MDRDRRTLGRYTLGPRLGVGGMAEVFRAEVHGAEGFRRKVALKVLLPDCRDDPELVEMFIEEARMCAELDHPNIISVFDFGEVEGERFMAMELVDGVDLAALLRWARARGEPLPLRTALRVGVELCRALGYAHQRDLVHRDVSPQNVFVTHAGVVKLGDFGIARSGARRSRTARGQIRGKLGYLAPEQVRDEALDGRTDLYALALVLFELATGEPYLKAESDTALLLAASDPPRRAPSQVRAEARCLDEALAAALEPHPLRRPRDAAALARSLQLAADQLGGLARPEDLVELVAAARAPTGTATSPRAAASAAAARPASADRRRAGAADAETGAAAVRGGATRQLDAPSRATRRGAPRALWMTVAALLVAGLGGAAWWFARHASTTADADSRHVADTSRPDDGAASASAANTRSAKASAAAAGNGNAAAEAGRTAIEPPADAATTRARPHRPARAARAAQRRRPWRSGARRAKAPTVARTPAKRSATPPAVAKRTSDAPDVSASRTRLSKALARARRRGLYAGDLGSFDRAVARARQQLAKGDAPGAARDVQHVVARVDAFRADRAFVERKLGRLRQALERASSDKRRAHRAASQNALRLVLGGQYAAASTRISRALRGLGAR